jgi:hypothetical protein
MIVTRNFEKIPYSERKDSSIPIHTFFKNLKFKVTIAKNLKTVKEILKSYVPNVICVDCQFEVDIRSDIQNMLPDISFFSDVIIIFYNAIDSIDSFHLENETKFARTFYFGTSFTLKEIQKVIYSLPNEKMKTQNDTTKDNDLTEKISNYSNSHSLSTTLSDLSIDQPSWKELTTIDDIYKFIDAAGFPVIIQPSYYQSGAAMSVVSNTDQLEHFLSLLGGVSKKYPVIISKN